MVQQQGTDTVRKLDLTKVVNDAKKAAGKLKGIGDRMVNKIMSLTSEEKSSGPKS
jgi:hypothetical protein